MRVQSSSDRGARRAAARLVAALIAVVALASGCISSGGASGGGGTGDKKSATLTFWTINLKKNFNDYITGLITSYEKDHSGIKIKWVDVPGADIATKLLSAIASGDVPDVVNIDSSNLGAFADKMVDLDKFVNKADLGDYQPGLVNSLRLDGGLRAIPWYNGGAPVGIYNMSVMKKVGFTPAAAPTNYDQVLTLAQKVYDKTKVYGTNVIPSYVTGVWSVLAYDGIPMLSADKKHAAFNTPAAVAELNKFKKVYDAHGIAPGAVSEDVRAFPQTLDNGKIAFQADAFPFVLTSLQTNSPSVYKNLVVTKAPATKDGKYLLPGQQTFAVPAASKNQAAAADFIKFITSGANQLAFCKLVPIYPSTVSTTQDAFFTKNTDTSPMGQARRIILAELPNITDGQLGTGKDSELDTELSNSVRAFMQGSGSAQHALSTAADAWNKTLASK